MESGVAKTNSAAGDLQDSAMAFKVPVRSQTASKALASEQESKASGGSTRHAQSTPHHLRKNFSRGWKISQSENDSNTKTKSFLFDAPSLPQIGRKMQPTPIAPHTDKNQTSLPLPST